MKKLIITESQYRKLIKPLLNENVVNELSPELKQRAAVAAEKKSDTTDDYFEKDKFNSQRHKFETEIVTKNLGQLFTNLIGIPNNQVTVRKSMYADNKPYVQIRISTDEGVLDFVIYKTSYEIEGKKRIVQDVPDVNKRKLARLIKQVQKVELPREKENLNTDF